MYFKLALFTKPIWSGPNPYRTMVRTKFGYVNGTKRYQKFGPDLVRTKAGPAHVQGPRSDRIWSGNKSGYVNAPCSSDQTKSLTFGGKSQSSNKNGELATWCKLVNQWKLDYYKNLEFIMIANIWRKNDKPCSSRVLVFVEILTPLGKISQNTAPSFLENLNLWCASFRRFVIQK